MSVLARLPLPLHVRLSSAPTHRTTPTSRFRHSARLGGRTLVTSLPEANDLRELVLLATFGSWMEV